MRVRRSHFGITWTTSILVGLGLGIAGSVYAAKEQSDNLPIEDVQRFSTAISQIKSYYVEPVSDKILFENAIRGMLTGLDPHSAYLDESEYADLKSHTDGEFGGLGIEVGMEEGYIRVVSPIDDTPAEKAGIKPGDLIIRLDNKPVKGMTLKEAVDIMRGKKGTDLNLTVLRKSQKKLLNFTITRDIIQIKSVKSKMLEDGYGYVRVSHFQAPTSENLGKAINKLKKQSHGKLSGLVVDLRNNPGGLLDSAIEVSDLFLDSKKLIKNDLIVFTKGRIAGSEMEVNATPGDLIDGTPIVVLINEGSASASEIVAGALQDHKRAVIMGTTSFGKGSVQTVLPLDAERGVKLTTALYYTPAGRSIQAKGIIPDIEVTDLEVNQDPDDENLVMAILKESDLDNHLANGNKEDANESTSENSSAENSTDEATDDEQASNNSEEPLAVSDYQLHEALNLLKALHIVSRQ